MLLTHTLPVLGALALVPMQPGVEFSIAKTYLLFQERAPLFTASWPSDCDL